MQAEAEPKFVFRSPTLVELEEPVDVDLDLMLVLAAVLAKTWLKSRTKRRSTVFFCILILSELDTRTAHGLLYTLVHLCN